MPTASLSVDLLRNLVLGVPLLLTLAVTVAAAATRPERLREVAPQALLGTVVSMVGLAVVHTGLAEHALADTGGSTLWEFAPSPVTVAGMPLEAFLGWALLWGALPALCAAFVPVPWWGWLAALAWIDLLTMPALEPFLVLTSSWWLGEALLLACVAAPTLLLLHATRARRWLWFRVTTQGVAFGIAVLWGVGSAALRHDGLGWADVVDHSLVVRAVLLMLAVAVAVPAVAAVNELARLGQGTPYPWDPPTRLVVTGPYAYLANPMQFGMVGLLLVLALAAGSPTLALAAAAAVVFSAALAEPHEQRTCRRRWPDHAAWRGEVRAWLPRWRPVVREPATLWVSRSCGVCAATGDALAAAGTIGLRRRDAESADFRITRMRWSVDGFDDRGVAAFARALEHINLATAWFGWLLRLPGVAQVAQLLADACGLGPRDLTAVRTSDTSRTRVEP